MGITLEASGTNSRANVAAERGKQYSLAKILGIRRKKHELK